MTLFGRRVRIALALGMTAAALASMAPVTQPARAAWTSQEDNEATDRLVLRNGRVVEGRILSESDAQIEMLVIVGGISAPTTYLRSEILSIERDIQAETESGVATPDRTKPRTPDQPSSRTRPTDSAGGARVYVVNLEGNLGREITKTPLAKAFDDAVSHNPDAIIVKMDAGSAQRGFDGLWTAEALGPIVEDVIDDGHRVIFWIKRAESGAAFLPLVSPDIFFMTEGLLGGVGDLSDFNIGDEVVNLKQISLRIGHAEGFAITGGYDPRLIRAMALEEEWLAVNLSRGAPEYITWEPRPEDGEGWIVLTDDGEGENKDEFSFEGNDVLTLDADWALRLGVADAVVDLLDDLIFELNIGRDYTVIKGRADQILSDWRDRIDRAEDQLQRLQRDLSDGGGGRNRMTPGRQINLLKQMRGVFTAYEEVFDPNGAQRASIDIQIEQLRQQIRRANQRGR